MQVQGLYEPTEAVQFPQRVSSYGGQVIISSKFL
jgi:hypothetical protein